MDNQFNSFDTQYPNLVSNLDETAKAVFYRKTYMHVALAVLAFIGVEALLLKIPFVVETMMSLTSGFLWIAILVAFGVGSAFANKMAHSMSRTTQYLGLGLYVIFEAIIFVPIIYIALYYSGGGLEMISQAGIITVGLFAGLTAVVFITNTNFSFLKTGLTIFFFIALAMIIAGAIFGFELGLWFSALMVVFAGGTILYQTSQLKYEYDSSQYVGAALGLFSSLMLLFWYILRIFMSRD